MQLDQITFTRFVAALTVVFFHYGNQVFPLNIPLLDDVLKAGPIAVNYFYLLSGFIMAIAYYRPRDKQAFNAKSYWWARFARIYPVYLLALLLIAVTKLKDPNIGTALALNTSLLQSWVPNYALSLNSPGWSLSVEAFFYLCFPFLLALVYRTGIKKITIIGLLLWFSTQVIHTILLNSDGYQAKNALHSFIYYNPLMHINAFILGIIVGVIFKDKPKILSQLQNHSTLGIIITTLLIAVIIAFEDHIAHILGFSIALTNGQIAPLFLLFIVFLSLDKSLITQLFSHRWLVLLGEASFSLYILQRPVHGIYERILQNRIDLSETGHFYLYLVILILVSIASYKLFETPMRKILRSISTKNKNDPIKPTKSLDSA